MAKFRVTINYANGDRELRFYYSDTLTKEDIEQKLMLEDSYNSIKSFKITYDAAYTQSKIASEITALVDDYKNNRG